MNSKYHRKICLRETTYVPPQNSTLVPLHRLFSISFSISFTSYSDDRGSGYASPNTARNPGIFCAVFKSRSLAYTPTFLRIQSMEICSILVSSGRETCALWLKSKGSGLLYFGSCAPSARVLSDSLWNLCLESQSLMIGPESACRRRTMAYRNGRTAEVARIILFPICHKD